MFKRRANIDEKGLRMFKNVYKTFIVINWGEDETKTRDEVLILIDKAFDDFLKMTEILSKKE